MKKTKVYSVRLQHLTQISTKCWKAEDWQGNTFLIPDSQYFGRDYAVQKSDAHWVASWIIDKEDCKLILLGVEISSLIILKANFCTKMCSSDKMR